MKHARDRCGIGCFRRAGSSTPASVTQEIASEILKEGLDFSYCSYGHAKESRLECAAILRRSGLFGFLFGMEAGSQKVLDLMGKPTTVGPIRSVVMTAKRAGICYHAGANGGYSRDEI